MLNPNAKKRLRISTSKVVILIYLLQIFFGAILLMLPIANKDGHWLNFFDAIFTSTSAVCITGLLKFDIALHFTLFGQIVILFLIQIGALGFMTMATFLFILIGKKIRLNERMLIKETMNHDSYQGIVRMARKIIIATFAIELIGALILFPSMLQIKDGVGNAVYRSIFLSVSSFCNAGFDVMGSVSGEFSSISYFAKLPLVLLPIAFLIIIGGLGFAVIFDIMKVHREKKVLFHTRIVVYVTLALITVGTFAFMLIEWSNPNTLGQFSSPADKVINALFMSITPRTAGFSCIKVDDMTLAGKALTSILAIIGASPASTGGGIKTTTFFVLLLLTLKGVNENNEIVYRKRTIPSKTVYKSLLVFFFAMTIIICLTFALCALESNNTSVNSFEALLFESINTFTTTGMTYGITPYLSRASLMLMSLVMLAGRLGILVISITILERGEQKNNFIIYPEGKIMVG